MTSRGMTHVDHPDDERFDGLTIECVERWKESELSGDEWRFSYVVSLLRKGQVVRRRGFSRFEWAVGFLYSVIHGTDNLTEKDQEAWNRTKDMCDQPGCPNKPTVFYARLKRYTRSGDLLAPSDWHDGTEYRQFCDRHKHRGDCALDDADHNYDEILDPRPVKQVES